MKPKNTLRSFLALAGSSLLAISSSHAGQIWDGGGTDNNWNTKNNWDGASGGVLPNFANAITFQGNTRNGAVNNLAADTTIGGIVFNNTGASGFTNAFTLSGARITLDASGITTTANTAGSTITDTISLDMILNGNRIITTNQQSDTVQHNLTISGIISQDASSRSLTKAGGGVLTITGTNSYTGSTIINGGTLNLGGGTATGSLDSTTLTLSGGAFSYTRTGGTTQGFTTTNINGGGANQISVVATNTLNLGTVTRGTGASFDFTNAGAGTVAALNGVGESNDATGIMAGFTYGNTWAVANGAGVAISGLADGSYTSTTGLASNAYAGNIDVDSINATPDAGITVNSLRFSESDANTLTLAGTNTITSGGILVGSGVGSNLSTIPLSLRVHSRLKNLLSRL